MAEIKMKSGRITIIDDSDFEWVSKLRLHCSVRKHNIYVQVSTYINKDFQKKRYQQLHRLILDVTDPKIFIDHKDGNGLNNRRDNLRTCNGSDNNLNRRVTWGTSKYKGVKKKRGRWCAEITINRKLMWLGMFDLENDAAKAYNNAAIATGNPFYFLNKV